ncbi:MAG: hypothetical protein HZB26_06545 [Candidatus Hydrogenedentes bacterium]|nr:hypothetical protein [Candidatus Hydrogenedentota bacterium]
MAARWMTQVAIGLALLVCAMSCHSGETLQTKPDEPAAPFVPGSSAITGTIKYDGAVPEFLKVPIDTSAVPDCAAHRTTPLYREDLVLGEGQALANVIVHITSGLPKRAYPVPTEPVELTQAGCQYAPHVFCIRVGQPLKVLNPEPMMHNVNANGKANSPFNMSMVSSVKEKSVEFDRPEFVVPFKCDVHPWMNAYCAVMDHPFFAVTGKDGKFTIANLDAGTYDIEAWHEALGVQKAKLQVAKDETKTIDFTFTKPSK